MKKDNYHVVGIMSGTSLDGIDLAEINFSLVNNQWHFEIVNATTIPYQDYWISKFKKADLFDALQLQLLNEEYTVLLSEVINHFISKFNISNLDAICSHGHTILHQPENGITLQIGNLEVLSTLTNQTIVCDFRVQDVLLGGQGAPLVPIGDELLFSKYDYCLNLGGFSNISFFDQHKRIAFDICPVNTVLNYLSIQLGYDYDDKGLISRNGNLILELFEVLNNHDFYKKKYPKSLGIEFVKSDIFPLLDFDKFSIHDLLLTYVEHIAYQISRVITKDNAKIIITGGGFYNDYLLERLLFYVPTLNIKKPQKNLVEFKEALIFGLLGVLKLRDDINVLSSVTGATIDHSSGKIFYLKDI